MSAAESLFIPRKTWTRVEAAQLSSLGFPNAGSLELVNGELIDRMGKNAAHVYWHTILRHWLESVFGQAYVRSEAPIDVAPEDNPTSEPEPDLTVTKRSIRESAENPKPDELRLVIEVSDSTLWYDLHVKAALYAKAGIAEYWVVNIPERKMVVHTSPARGMYTEQQVYGFDQTMSVGDTSLCLNRL